MSQPAVGAGRAARSGISASGTHLSGRHAPSKGDGQNRSVADRGEIGLEHRDDMAGVADSRGSRKMRLLPMSLSAASLGALGNAPRRNAARVFGSVDVDKKDRRQDALPTLKPARARLDAQDGGPGIGLSCAILHCPRMPCPNRQTCLSKKRLKAARRLEHCVIC